MKDKHFEELFRRLAVSYHYEYDSDYLAEREEIIEAWNNMVPAAKRAGMTGQEIQEIFDSVGNAALESKRRQYEYEQEHPSEDVFW